MSAAAGPLPPEAFASLLAAAESRFGFSLSFGARQSLGVFLAELDRWRRKINLTGALSAEELATHGLESLAGARLIPDGSRIIDIGSGGGFPAVPIAVERPDVRLTMLEPRGKRASFLRHVVRTLGLENSRVLEARVETLEAALFDVATSRAVGRLSPLIGRAPFLKAGGLLLVWTTDAAALAHSLGKGFLLESITPLPGSDRRAIGAFRKR